MRYNFKHGKNSIDLTRMECKGKKTCEQVFAIESIDLTRMECKGLKGGVTATYLQYRFNQNGM